MGRVGVCEQGVWLRARGGASIWVGGLSLALPSSPHTGGLQAVAELLQVDHEMHGLSRDPLTLALRRYAGMALTNLTFGDVANKVPVWGGSPGSGQPSTPWTAVLVLSCLGGRLVRGSWVGSVCPAGLRGPLHIPVQALTAGRVPHRPPCVPAGVAWRPSWPSWPLRARSCTRYG